MKKAELYELVETLRRRLDQEVKDRRHLEEQHRKDHKLLHDGILPAVVDSLKVTGGNLNIEASRDVIDTGVVGGLASHFVLGRESYEVTYEKGPR